jgi:predicted lipid-binding transport protein (Tim44 family)
MGRGLVRFRRLSPQRRDPHVLPRGPPLVKPLDAPAGCRDAETMTGLAVILLIVGIVLLLLGLFIEAAKFLLWIGIVIVIIAVIAWLMRFIRRQT